MNKQDRVRYNLTVIDPKTKKVLFDSRSGLKRSKGERFTILSHDLPRIGDDMEIEYCARDSLNRMRDFRFRSKVVAVVRSVLACFPKRDPEGIMFDESDWARVEVMPTDRQFSNAIKTLKKMEPLAELGKTSS